MCQAFELQAHHTQIDPCLAGSMQKFLVFTHPASPANPGDRPLYYPATWERLETCWPQWWFLVCAQPLAPSAWSLNDLQAPTEGLPDPRLQRPTVPSICPDQVQPWEGGRRWLERRQQPPRAPAIRDVGRMHQRLHDQAEGINEQVAFAPR